jgi:hypothetical protein
MLLLAAVLSAHAAVPVSRFESTVIVNPDTSLVVVENVELPIPVSGFQRTLPVRSVSPIGRRTLLVDVISVEDEKGQRLKHDDHLANGLLTITVAQVTTSHTAKFTYTVRNAVRFFGDHDELLWPGTDSQLQVEDALLHIKLPAGSEGQYRAQAYIRRDRAADPHEQVPQAALWSSDGRVPVIAAGNTIELRAPGPLTPGVTLAADVFFHKGVLHRPNLLTRIDWYTQSNPIVFLPLIAFVLMGAVRWWKRRNTDPQRAVVPVYEPPAGLTPAEVGVLVDDRLDPRDVTATFVDLAVRGYIRIEEGGKEHGLINDRQDFILRLRKPLEEWGELALHERTVLFHTFYGGQWTKLSSLRLRFHEVVPIVRQEVLRALRNKGMYRVDPSSVQVYRQAGWAAVAVALIIGQLWGVFSIWDSLLPAIIAIALTVLVIYLLGRGISAKTLRGMRTYTDIKGFQEFLHSVESDRIERLDSTVFERYLPFAMALGLEQRWTRSFQGIAQIPEWYQFAEDGKLFDSTVFGHRMEAFAYDTMLAAVTAARGKRGGIGPVIADTITEQARAQSHKAE